MPGTHSQLYVHLVWATWDRLPLITPELELLLYREMHSTAHRIGAEIRAIGGLEDHVHVLVQIPSTLPVATLVKRLKGSSSHLAGRTGGPFKWQGAYGAFSVSRWDLSRIERYIRKQKEHHGVGSVSNHLERVHGK